MVAQELGRRLGVSVLLVDDLRIAAQALTTPTSHPDLHVFASDRSVHQMGPEAAVAGFLAVAGAMAPAVLTVVAHHLVVEGAGPVIIEGDGLLPATIAGQHYGALKLFHGLAPSRAVRMVVVHEPDESQLFANFRDRGRGFGDLAAPEQASLVHASWRYGEWLRDDARAHGVPVVATRTHETLAARVLSAAEAGRLAG